MAAQVSKRAGAAVGGDQGLVRRDANLALPVDVVQHADVGIGRLRRNPRDQIAAFGIPPHGPPLEARGKGPVSNARAAESDQFGPRVVRRQQGCERAAEAVPGGENPAARPVAQPSGNLRGNPLAPAPQPGPRETGMNPPAPRPFARPGAGIGGQIPQRIGLRPAKSDPDRTGTIQRGEALAAHRGIVQQANLRQPQCVERGQQGCRIALEPEIGQPRQFRRQPVAARRDQSRIERLLPFGVEQGQAGGIVLHERTYPASIAAWQASLYMAPMSSIRPWRDIQRRKSRQIMVGTVPVGGDAPITVQTMTNTLTSDAVATIDQIRRCEDAGADLIRVSCPDEASTAALGKIAKAARVPLIADIHFHYKRALEAADAGAACLRINPGNIGSSDRVAEVVRAAKANGCAIRIGVNAGSLEKDLLEKYGEPCPEALVESALDHIKLLQDHDFHEYKVAVKASDVFLAVAAYNGLADAVDCPLHLGITEAGGLIGGTVKSSIGIGNLLWAGIGDTIRVSLSAEPEEEVRVGFEILKGLGLRTRGVRIVSCPSCARQGFDVIRTVEALESRLSHIKTPMSLSVLGCVVNGPGEARETDIGVTGGGNGKHMVYLSGVTDHHVQSEAMLDHIVGLVEAKAAELEAVQADPAA